MPLHLIDVIRYTGENTKNILAWKEPNVTLKPGTKLEVMPNQLAIFVKSGRVAEMYEQGKHEVAGQSTPFLTGVTKMFTGGVDPYSAILYFINKPDQIGIQWGTADPIQIPVPGTVSARSGGLSLPAGAHGRYSVTLDYEKSDDPQVVERNKQRVEAFFGQFVSGHDVVTRKDVSRLISQRANSVIRTMIAQAFIKLNIPINQIDASTAQIGDVIAKQLEVNGVFKEFEERYGLKLLDFTLDAISIDKSSAAYLTYSKLANRVEERAATAESKLYDDQLDAQGAMAHTDAAAYDQQQRGYTYQQARTMDVLQAAAENTGTGSDLMNGAIGLGVGLHAGGAIVNGLGAALASTGTPDFASLVTPPISGPNAGAAPTGQPAEAAPTGSGAAPDGAETPAPAASEASAPADAAVAAPTGKDQEPLAQAAAQFVAAHGGQQLDPDQVQAAIQAYLAQQGAAQQGSGTEQAGAAGQSGADQRPTVPLASPNTTLDPAERPTVPLPSPDAASASSASAAQPAPAAPAADPVESLGKLKQLHDLGLITDEQFTAKQQEILSRL